jgi:hypothetical protein
MQAISSRQAWSVLPSWANGASPQQRGSVHNQDRRTRQDRQAGIENGVPVPSFCRINGVLQQLSSSGPADWRYEE